LLKNDQINRIVPDILRFTLPQPRFGSAFRRKSGFVGSFSGKVLIRKCIDKYRQTATDFKFWENNESEIEGKQENDQNVNEKDNSNLNDDQ